jgi:hypothetical protein
MTASLAADVAPPRYTLDGFAMAERAFAARFPEFDPDDRFATLRRLEYGRLDADDQVYLDYTGGGLHAASQLDAHIDLLRKAVLGNPHSNNPTSLAATALVERTRDQVCDFRARAVSRLRALWTDGAPRLAPHRRRCRDLRQRRLRRRPIRHQCHRPTTVSGGS